jgi:hypothetical protein
MFSGRRVSRTPGRRPRFITCPICRFSAQNGLLRRPKRYNHRAIAGLRTETPLKTFAWHFVLAVVLSPSSLPAQNGPAVPSQSEQLATSIARAKSGNVDTSDVEIIAEAGAVQAIPSLEEQFGRTTDVDTKTKIANGLVRLGDKHNTYWNYLLEQATLAMDRDFSDAFFSGPVGNAGPDVLGTSSMGSGPQCLGEHCGSVRDV